jgi:hypothetical protein
LVRIPVEVVERVLQELIEDGRIRSVPNIGFVAPNYMDANDAPRSDRARQADSRQRRRQAALSGGIDQYGTGDASHDVTLGHAASRPVTQYSTFSTDHYQSAPALPPPQDTTAPAKKKRRGGIPEDWQPRTDERELASRLGLDCDAEADEFKAYWLGDGRPKSDWHQTFRNRLMAQGKRKPGQGGFWPSQSTPTRKIEKL